MGNLEVKKLNYKNRYNQSKSLVALLLQKGLQGGLIVALILGSVLLVWAASTNWQFTTAGDYTYDSAKIEVTGGVARLKGAVSGWYNSAWSKRRSITITGSTGGTQTDYAVKVDVTYDSDMQTDFDDIRFTASNGTTSLDHWRGTYTNSGTGTFWVKIPFIPISPGTAAIYMYYGNTTASSASNGSNTFVFFDDFETGTTSRWTSVSAPGSGDSVTVATDDKHSGVYSLKMVEGGGGR